MTNQNENSTETFDDHHERHPSNETEKELNEAEQQIKVHKFRNELPSPMVDRSKFSIWSILKQCVDKELYRFTIPIVWNEPLSLLQRLAENMKYADRLLDKAANLSNPIDRMKCVAGFLVSSTSIHNDRLSKPFNPLLGETYELVSIEKKFRICCEQVSHHPPISAFHSESIRPTASNQSKWKYYGSVNPHMKLNILNASMDIYPEGIQTIEFPELDEIYTWHNLKITAHNLVLGKIWFENHGKCEIINHKLNMKCVLEFKPYSWFSRQMNRCEGYILDSNDNKVALLYGKIDDCLFSVNETKNSSDFGKKCEKIIANDEVFMSVTDEHHRSNKLITNQTGIELIWKSECQEDEYGKRYPSYFNFTKFTMMLNELYDDLTMLKTLKITDDLNHDLSRPVQQGPLPITDSRLRPDMQLYEKGKIDEASSEKCRLEEKQREAQRKMESGEVKKFKPLWFEKSHHFKNKHEETWQFNDKYWERDYNNCPQIF